MSKALEYNKRNITDADTIKRIQETVGATPDGVWGPKTVAAVEDWQEDEGLSVDGMVGPRTLKHMQQDWSGCGPDRDLEEEAEWRDLTADEIDKMIQHTTTFEGGRHNPYGALNADAEWEGWFDRPKRDSEGNKLHPRDRTDRFWASKYNDHGGTHVGASVGPWQVTQDAGTLGKTLQRHYELDPDGHEKVFRGAALSKELREITNRRGRDRKVYPSLDKGKRSPRVQPVGGEDIWKGAWRGVWKEAANLESWQRACRDIAKSSYFDKIIPYAQSYGFTKQGHLAVLFDIAIQFGPGGCKRRMRNALGRTPVVRDRTDADLKKVIKQLPKARRPRRYTILSRCEPNVHYTLPE